jgi:hypothetical protein
MDDLDDVFALKHPIDHDEGQQGQRQFARTLYTARPAAMREASQRVHASVNGSADALRRDGIVPADAGNNVFEFGRRIGRPANAHLRLKHLFEAGPDFVVREKLPTVKLVHARGHLLPEPSIVLE